MLVVFKKTKIKIMKENSINRKVIGVLKYNNDIRKKLLERNIGLYNQLNPDEGIGYISNVYSKIESKPFSFDKNGLLGYTHFINDSYITSNTDSFFNEPFMTEYQKYIKYKYDFDDIKYYYKAGSLSDSNNLKWNGKYRSYCEYINEILGVTFTPLEYFLEDLFLKDNKLTDIIQDKTLKIHSVINDFVQYDNIKYAMEKNRIGTITPNPLAALMGAVTTNVNGFSVKDTSLGLITNQLYANTLQRGAIFNSIRRTQYITPKVYEKLGNKLSTIATLGADFRIDDETGRLAYDLGSDFNGTYNLEYNNFDELFGDNEYWKESIIEGKNIANNDYLRLKNLKENHLSVSSFFNKQFYLPFISSQNTKPYVIYNKLTGQFDSTFSKSINKNDIWFEGDNKEHSNFLETENYNISTKINDKNSLLYKTHKQFQAHDHNGIDTLIGRYHTSGDRDTTHNEKSLLQSAVNNVFGMSHGRNLLTKKAYENNFDVNRVNGYSNPYCRVWTKSLRYGMTNHLIRPFKDDEGMIIDMEDIQNTLKTHIRNDEGKGVKILKDNSVLKNNGFITITPTEENRSIKKYMFSIENLAWKDYGNENNLSEEQIGPNGGRIMWFPPYGLTVQDNVGVDWGPNDFIGRGEKIYSYKNTERTGTLSFILLVDNPSILSEWNKYGEKENGLEEQEQQLLRFFSGNEPLKLKERKDEETKEKKETLIITEENYVPTEVERDTIDEDFVFYIYFPNNYSGVDDDDFEDALNYLINEYDNHNITPIYSGLKWEYRVDEKYRNKTLKYEENYKDDNTFGINRKHIKDVLLFYNWGKYKDIYNDVTHSLKDMNDNFNEILKFKIIDKIEITGFATSIGNKNDNDELIKHRVLFGEKFIRKKLLLSDIDIETGDSMIVDLKYFSDYISYLDSKLNRCVKITLKTKEFKEKTFQEMYNNAFIPSIVATTTDATTTDVTYTTSDKVNFKTVTLRKNVKKTEETITTYITEKIPKNPHRSDEEYKYFKMLESNNSFLYSKLVDKIKYFTPAFHSITPEGFNSRLSFLHQCTRQGPTLSISDTNNELKSAGNLAFGRPPICVLRIGDFYHTRIIIDSLNIDFTDSTWDMNPEGIGVQPMLAKVNLNFKFLGGSDLCAPVSRLQNALSFNYYANQGVYDNRSDKGKYDNNNSVIDGEPWTPK